MIFYTILSFESSNIEGSIRASLSRFSAAECNSLYHEHTFQVTSASIWTSTTDRTYRPDGGNGEVS